MKPKQFISFILSLVSIALLVTACQSGEQGNTENSPVQSGGKDSAETASDATSSQNELTMSVFELFDEHLEAAALLYEEKTGVKVNIENNYYEPDLDSPGRDWDTSIYTDQAITALMAGGGADIYGVEWMDYESLGKNGLLVDMSSWLDADEQFSDETVFRDILLSGKTGSGVFAIPISFYYRKVFASSEDEVFPENRRMTWREFFETVSANGYTQELAYFDRDIDVFMQRFIERAAEFIDEEGNTQALDSPYMVALLEECRDWRDAGLFADISDPKPFVKSYSYIGYPIGRANIADALCTLPEEYVYGHEYYGHYVSPMPYDGEAVVADGVERYPIRNTDISFFGVNAASPNAEAAQDFLKFLLSEEAQEAMMAADTMSIGFKLPLNRGAFRGLVEDDFDKRIQSSLPDIELDVQSFVAEAEGVIDEITYIFPEKPYYRTIIREAAMQFLLGDISAEEAARQMANKVDLYLKEQG